MSVEMKRTPDYIDREAFIKRLEHEADLSSGMVDLFILNGLANIVRDKNIAPTVDVVEVVRCKNCKHWIRHPKKWNVKNWGECLKSLTDTNHNHFCGYGEKAADE